MSGFATLTRQCWLFAIGSAFFALATAPGLLQLHALRGLASAEPPMPCPPMGMYMVWHVRHQHDAAHRWLREQLEAVVEPVLSAAPYIHTPGPAT